MTPLVTAVPFFLLSMSTLRSGALKALALPFDTCTPFF